MDDAILEPALATVEAMLAAEGMGDAASIVRSASPELAETGWDNWNGGTKLFTIYLSMDPADFARLGDRQSTIENQITARAKTVFERDDNEWYSVALRPKVIERHDWRKPTKSLSRVARQNIIDGLKIDKVAWMGTLDDVEFLERLYDLKTLPSTDSRYKDAAGDIWQHRRNNFDWEDDWIYGDTRFGLLSGSAEQFLAFLAETVHPVVRPDRNEALNLVRNYNDQLKPEGWMLVEVEKIAGRPKFVAKPTHELGGRSVMRARTVADSLGSGPIKCLREA